MKKEIRDFLRAAFTVFEFFCEEILRAPSLPPRIIGAIEIWKTTGFKKGTIYKLNFPEGQSPVYIPEYTTRGSALLTTGDLYMFLGMTNHSRTLWYNIKTNQKVIFGLRIQDFDYFVPLKDKND